MTVYRQTSVLLAVVTIGLGIALLAVTVAHGGGGLGFLLGILFVAAGAGRLYLHRATRGGRQ
jgi:4-hydroxybenzoate polyprenyltransferase